MAFTRFHDDPCRIEKQLQEITDPGRYIIDVPGNGPKPFYINDPYIRLQGWGANLRTNCVDLESALNGLDRPLNSNFNPKLPINNKINYPTYGTITDQPRATNPAWEVRGLQRDNFNYLFFDPQQNTCIPFRANLNTRLLERDYFVDKAPCITNQSCIKR